MNKNILLAIKSKGLFMVWASIIILLLYQNTLAGSLSNVKQGVVINGIKLFVRDYYSDDLNKVDLEDMSKGICYGLSSLWLYSKYLQFYPDIIGKPQDDYRWFKTNVEIMVEKANNLRSLLASNELDQTKRFVSLVWGIHNSQLVSLSDTFISKSIRGFESAAIETKRYFRITVNLEQLTSLLKMENYIKDDQLILISFKNHTVGLFKHNNYYYYDPNNTSGEIQTNSIEEVVKLIFSSARAFSLWDYYTGWLSDQKLKLSITSYSVSYTDQQKVTKYEGCIPYLKILDNLPAEEKNEFFIQVIKNMIRTEELECLMPVSKSINLDNVELEDFTRTGVLAYAARNGRKDIVGWLLESGANANRINSSDETPLFDSSPECIATIIKHGGKVDHQNHLGETALIRSVIYANANDDKKIEVLINAGASLNIQDNDGTTALMSAATGCRIYPSLFNNSWEKGRCKKKLLEKLIQAGADPSLKNNYGKTAAMLARSYANDECAELIEKWEVDFNLKNQTSGSFK